MSDELIKQIQTLEKLLKKQENKECADCRRKSPSWASILFGIFICIKCSGFHRELSTSIAKVKSVDLDKWPKGVVDLYMRLNNTVANDYWESSLDKERFDFKRIRDDDNLLRDFIYDKYQKRKWVGKGKCPMTRLYNGEKLETEVKVKDKETVGKKMENENVRKTDVINESTVKTGKIVNESTVKEVIPVLKSQSCRNFEGEDLFRFENTSQGNVNNKEKHDNTKDILISNPIDIDFGFESKDDKIKKLTNDIGSFFDDSFTNKSSQSSQSQIGSSNVYMGNVNQVNNYNYYSGSSMPYGYSHGQGQGQGYGHSLNNVSNVNNVNFNMMSHNYNQHQHQHQQSNPYQQQLQSQQSQSQRNEKITLNYSTLSSTLPDTKTTNGTGNGNGSKSQKEDPFASLVQFK